MQMASEKKKERQYQSFIKKQKTSLLQTPAIGLMSRVFTNGPRDWVSIPGHVIPKTQNMVLDANLLSTHHYKVCIKGKVEQSREWSSTFPYISV